MAFKVERLPNEPIIVVTWQMPVDTGKETPQTFVDIDALIGPDETVYCITDLRAVNIDFGTLVTAMAAQRVKAPGSPSDPRLRSSLVGTGMLWEIASRGAKQLQYGGLDIPLYSSLEDALANAREKIKEWGEPKERSA